MNKYVLKNLKFKTNIHINIYIYNKNNFNN